jgi:hypothetical protein
MSDKGSDLTDEEILAIAKERGLPIRRRGIKLVRYTITVENDLLIRFKEAVQLLRYKVSEATTQALELWLHSKEDEITKAEKNQKEE